MEGITQAKTEAWFYNPEGEEDQTTPHQFVPNRSVSPDSVRDLGVLIWKLDTDSYVDNPLLETIKTERGYKHTDVITFAPGEIPNFEDKAKHFFVEHIHAVEEIRFVLAGAGYFDVRDLEDNWIRVKVTKGDFVILPPGMYHRFTLDRSLYIKALRLFIELPAWTDETRPADENVAKYTEVARCAGTDNCDARHEYLVKMGVNPIAKPAGEAAAVIETVYDDEILTDLSKISLHDAILDVDSSGPIVLSATL